MTREPNTDSLAALRRIYPSFDTEALKEAESFWTRYLELALLIYEELRAEPKRYAELQALTKNPNARTMNRQRSNTNQSPE